MTRVQASPETITVKPMNNIYTVLVISAVLVQIIGLIVIFLRASKLFGGLF